MLSGFRWQHKGVDLHDYELVTDVYLKYRAVSNCVCVCVSVVVFVCNLRQLCAYVLRANEDAL